MADVKTARMLSDAAKRDVDALRVMIHSNQISDEVFGFHVQQAAEKLLKAWIALMGEVYPLTHNIEGLLGLLDSRGASVEPFRNLVEFTPFAVEFRYTGIGSDTEPIDREGALAIVASLHERIGRQVANVGGTC